MKLTYNGRQATRKDLINLSAIIITVSGIISGTVTALVYDSLTYGIDPWFTLIFILLFLPSSFYVLFGVCIKAIMKSEVKT
jgi:hypothetical protein